MITSSTRLRRQRPKRSVQCWHNLIGKQAHATLGVGF
jgi:hypothetical protein